MKEYIFWFSETRPGFGLAEIQSLFSLFNIPHQLLLNNNLLPYTIVKCDDEIKIREVAQRSVCTKFVIHLWTQSNSHENLRENLASSKWPNLSENISKDRSFKFRVYSFGKKISLPEKIERIERLNYLPFEGEVDLTQPDNIFYLIEFFGTQKTAPPEDPIEIFFGKWVADGNRQAITELSLKRRKFISNTSMDPLFALMMANLALVKVGDIVLDPFVGSGSLLIAASYFGGYAIGSDIDFLLIHGLTKPTRANSEKREPDESILTNYQQYRLQSKYLDMLVGDASKPLWREFEFDAIVTDPPYGIRENSQRVGTIKNYKIPEKYIPHHIPSKQHYNLESIVCDLFNFAVFNLKLKGRLVFWFPKSSNDDLYNSVPNHPAFKLVSCCLQNMAQNVDRVLVCYELQERISKGPLIPQAIKTFRTKYFENLRTDHCKLKK